VAENGTDAAGVAAKAMAAAWTNAGTTDVAAVAAGTIDAACVKEKAKVMAALRRMSR
jgi:hypothetical protein